MSNLDCWDINSEQFPALGTRMAQLEFLLRYAILAPSNHNTQPWIFDVSVDRITLLADRSRSLPECDPGDRELTISCGVALFFLETAAKAYGFDISVSRVDPTENPNKIAEVHIGKLRSSSQSKFELLDAIVRRRTNRGVFSRKPLDPIVQEALSMAVAENGAVSTWVDIIADRQHLAKLIMLADRRQFESLAFRNELAKWVNPTRNGKPDGIPAKSIGFDAPTNYLAPLLIRTFDLGADQASFHQNLVRSSAGLMVLSTGFDSMIDWIRAGEALGRVLLAAENLGVNVSYLNQPCEIEELRSRLVDTMESRGHPQLVLRFGYGFPVSPTPRRSLADVMRSRSQDS